MFLPAALSARNEELREMLARVALGRARFLISSGLGNEYSVNSSTAMLWALRAGNDRVLSLICYAPVNITVLSLVE